MTQEIGDFIKDISVTIFIHELLKPSGHRY